MSIQDICHQRMEIVHENLVDYLNKFDLKMVPIEGDGHCLLNSIITCLDEQGEKYEFKEIQKRTKDEINNNQDRYIDWVLRSKYSESDDRIPQLIAMLDSYFERLLWNGRLCDLLPLIFAYTFNLHLTYYQIESPNSFKYNHFFCFSLNSLES